MAGTPAAEKPPAAKTAPEGEAQFVVEQLLDGQTTGSLLAITFNEFGHAVASREQGGVLLIHDGDGDGLLDHVRVANDQIKDCRGLLCLNGELFATGTGPQGLALYRPGILEPGEVEALLGALRTRRDRAMVEAMVLGGLRRCEVLGLRLGDLRLGGWRGFIAWGQGGAQTPAPVSQSVFAAVRDLNRRAVLGWRARFRAIFDEIAAVYPPREEIDLDALADMVSTVVEGGSVMGKALGGTGKIGYIFHDASYYVTNQRDGAFKTVIRQCFPGIEIVTEPGITDPAQGQEVAPALPPQNA